MNGETKEAGNHNLILEGRKKLTMTGVIDMDVFDDQTFTAVTELGVVTVRGEELHIGKLDVNTRQLELEGQISSIAYSDQPMNQGSFLQRLFR